MKQKILNYVQFKEDQVYILLLLSRKKDNTQLSYSKDRKANRYIFNNEGDLDKALESFQSIVDSNPDIQYRLYLSVNSRSLLKGLFNMQKELMAYQKELIYGNNFIYQNISLIGSKWKSVLAGKDCRAEKYFAFDIDFSNSEEHDINQTMEFKKQIEELTAIKYFGKSKTGFAMVTEPFNLKNIKLPEEISCNSDGYLYIHSY